MHELAVFAIALAGVGLVELPDKTLVATLVLTTRYRRAPVLIGVAGAFAVQCAIAVTAGGLLRLLPSRAVDAAVAVLFAVGAAVLLRQGFGATDDAVEQTRATESTASPLRIATISFGVLFAAEWGDASQLATAGLEARYGAPLAVGVGAFLALLTVAALASLLSKVILDRIAVAWIHRVAGLMFAAFAALAAVAAVRA